MIEKYLSGMWNAVAPAMGNHLWQSTLFAIVAGLLTLTLRKNHARARYGLWLAASLKFLVPFSLLVGIGSHLGWHHASSGTTDAVYFAMDEFGRPFTQSAAPAISRATPTPPVLGLIHSLPVFLSTIWLCGFLAILFVWCARWSRMSAAMRDAVPLREGREVEALRRLELERGIRRRIEMLLSRASLEPGIFRIARPVLVWPESISERLEDMHVEAILAHEVGHVRRRDNLAAVAHMLVEAIFWFHPLVWWMGARLVEEREIACDEEVLEFGNQPQVYAESILKVCEFCIGSPLACVSGVTGADLKKRIVHIMTQGAARKLNLSKKLLLGVAGIAAIAMPVAFGLSLAGPILTEAQAQYAQVIAPKYEFAVASIKPNKSGGERIALAYSPDGFTAVNVTLRMLVRFAFGPVEDNRILEGPDWENSERFDIDARVDSGAVDGLQKLAPAQLRLARQSMLQALLADRFKLTVHRETKEIPVYAIVIAKNGPKLHESKPGDTYPNGLKGADGRGGIGLFGGGRGGPLTGQGATIGTLATVLSQQVGRIILDKTGLTGRYDFTLQWTPDQGQAAMGNGGDGAQSVTESTASIELSGPSVFTAIQDQLGLKLESQKAPVDVLVIDRAERPSVN